MACVLAISQRWEDAGVAGTKKEIEQVSRVVIGTG